MSDLPIALTCGDPAGVGPEIIRRWCAAYPLEAESCVVIGPADLAESVSTPAHAVGPHVPISTGEPSLESAHCALAAMQEAAAGCREGRYRAVVTGPVSKAWLKRVGFIHEGQTEFFAAQWGGEPSMAFVGERLRLVLATWHMPLMDVGPFLEAHPEAIERAVERADALARRLTSAAGEARIAVCGLNPHAGEEGLLGSEEQRFIDPLLTRLKLRFPGLSSTLPADTVFFRALRDEFDVIVALYHDQGLGPLKTIEFDAAVNVSLGLGFVRTSPDHGTGFSIAGKGLASPNSFAHAVEVCRQLCEI